MLTHQGTTTQLMVSFGPTYAGVATVGYALKNPDGTVFQARTTTGVRDWGHGYYGVTWTPAATFTGVVEWDTGGGSPVYAREEVTVDALSDVRVARLDYVSSSTVVTAPVATDNAVTIIRGDDYRNADGRALEWVNASGSWPNLTGASISFATNTGLSVAGTVVTPTGAGQKVRVELTSANTQASPTGPKSYDVQATLSGGNKVTLATGSLLVRQDFAA